MKIIFDLNTIRIILYYGGLFGVDIMIIKGSIRYQDMVGCGVVNVITMVMDKNIVYDGLVIFKKTQ